MMIESWSSWRAALTSRVPLAIQVQYSITTGSCSSTANMRAKFTSTSTKAASITPGPIQLGRLCVASRVPVVGPSPEWNGSYSPPARTASADFLACESARAPFSTKPISGSRTIRPGRKGSKAACSAPASTTSCPPCASSIAGASIEPITAVIRDFTVVVIPVTT